MKKIEVHEKKLMKIIDSVFLNIKKMHEFWKIRINNFKKIEFHEKLSWKTIDSGFLNIKKNHF